MRVLDKVNQFEGSKLPVGTEIAVVTRQGQTLAAPAVSDSHGVATVAIADLKPREGVIMPAPYPTMLTRFIPVTENSTYSLTNINDIEFVELIIPQQAGEKQALLLERIWLE